MAIAITITPADDGWTLRAGSLGMEQHFLSGSRAESAGRALANSLARTGQAAELEIRLRDGTLGGHFRVGAS
jgi:hypothetical protein